MSYNKDELVTLLKNGNIAEFNKRRKPFRILDLSGADLSGVDLRGANLQGTNFTGANLTGAKLEGAYIQGANFTDAVGLQQ